MIRALFLELPIIGRFAIDFGLIVLLPRLAEHRCRSSSSYADKVPTIGPES